LSSSALPRKEKKVSSFTVSVNSNFPQNEISLASQLKHKVPLFKAGQIKNSFSHWKELTSDKEVLSIVSGFKIPLLERPVQRRIPSEICFNSQEKNIISHELATLLGKRVIVPSKHEEGEFISTIFIRQKKDGISYRLILNLSSLNEFIEYRHFKMESLATAISLTKTGCFFGSIDLKDAYYSVPIAADSQKLLKFYFGGHLYQFTCLPNGLACAPRIFTKLLKPVYAHLRAKGFESVAYIDDSCLFGQTAAEAKANIMESLHLFEKLGFTIHPEKSVLEPTQCITFLGFMINSCSMTVKMTPEKKESLFELCNAVLKRDTLPIRAVAQLVGKMNSCCAGLQYGPLFYRTLENEKTAALKSSNGDFDAFMQISEAGRRDVSLFMQTAESGQRPISKSEISLEIRSDASLKGYGGVLIDALSRNEIVRTQGEWSAAEAKLHINVLELKAAFHCLNDFCNAMSNIHVRLLMDSTTGVCYVKNQGGTRSLQCNSVARQIWDFCKCRQIDLTVSHIPGEINSIADAQSRNFNQDTEWMLNPDTFKVIVAQFGKPCIDLFASRLNHQLKPYASWRPDGNAQAIDAFTIPWGNFALAYCFPPFSLLTRVLQKAEADQATCLLVYPLWSAQPWFPRLQRGITMGPFPLPRSTRLLTLPQHPGLVHPLASSLRLMACIWSKKP